MLAGALEWPDPTDLDGSREALKHADPEGRLAPVGMSRVKIGHEALGLLPEVVSEFAGGPHVVLVVVDATPMRRCGGDLKDEVERMLAGRFEVRRATIGEDTLHADEAALDEITAAVSGVDCVVVVGSGTITDLAKETTARAGTPPLVVAHTAASVNAFSDDIAVLLKSGAKRTVVSRWPDALLIDLPVLAGAPPAMNLAGFGDLISMWIAPPTGSWPPPSARMTPTMADSTARRPPCIAGRRPCGHPEVTRSAERRDGGRAH